MKKTEIIIAIGIVISICMNIFLIPGGKILSFITLSLGALFYFFFSFALFNNNEFRTLFNKLYYKESSLMKIIGAIMVGFAFYLILLGIMFYFQSYKGAVMVIFIGLNGLIVAIIIGIIKFFKTKSKYYKNIFIRVIIIGGLGLFFILVPKIKILEFKYRNHQQYMEALKKAYNEPRNIELWKNAEIERKKIYE